MDLSIYKAKPQKSIREHTDDLLNNLDIIEGLDYIKSDYVYKLAKIACEYHDYGKANREFQNRINNNTAFNENIEMAHNVLSLYFINESKFENIEDYYKVAFAVLYHHNYCDNLKALQGKENKELAKNLLNNFEINNIKLSTPKNLKRIAKTEDAILIKGFLHKCDYSASADLPIEHKNDFLNSGLNKLLEKWKSENENANWNELQEFCMNNTDENILVVAQTGMGKTEGGLHWIGDNKGFFILPLKTAINSIYKRVKEEILEENDIESKLALLHSDALSYYNSDNSKELDVMDYYKQSRQLSIPLNISTMDQLFDFVFKYQGYELKLTTLSYSKIVIDEIQMYSADLLAYLINGIKIINKFGGKVAILTATLAPFIRDKLKSGENPVEFKEMTFINDSKRHNLKVYDSEIDSETIYCKFEENKQKGISNKILVVCNTVKKAQEIYKELEEIGVENINILHSKFIKSERSQKEKEIMEFGKTEIKGTGIWIATQIVEASLDIDFDYLFTELSEITGLFQRLGRCNRKGVKPTEEHNCFVFLNINKNLLTNGDKGFIDSRIYELSKNALKDINGVLTENEKINIIEENLTTEKLKGSDYLVKYNKFSKWISELEPYEIDKEDVMIRDIISYNVIPNVIYEANKDEIEENSRKLLKSINPKISKSEKEKVRLGKLELKEKIKKYTVPVGRNDIFFKGENLRVSRVQLSRNEFVDVVNCKYDKLGFIRATSTEIKGLVDNFDNFM